MKKTLALITFCLSTMSGYPSFAKLTEHKLDVAKQVTFHECKGFSSAFDSSAMESCKLGLRRFMSKISIYKPITVVTHDDLLDAYDGTLRECGSNNYCKAGPKMMFIELKDEVQ